MSRKYFGEHSYPGCDDDKFHFTSDCAYGCECWMGSSRSGGPDGISPFGECPKNEISAEKYVLLLEKTLKNKEKYIDSLRADLDKERQVSPVEASVLLDMCKAYEHLFLAIEKVAAFSPALKREVLHISPVREQLARIRSDMDEAKGKSKDKP